MADRTRTRFAQTLRYAVASIALIFFLFPILWIILTAFKTGAEFMHEPPVWIPQTPTLASFENVITSGGLNSLTNSLVISSVATGMSLVIGSLAAYGLSRYRVGGDDLPFFILSQRFMPPVAVIFPFLLVFKALRWMDTWQALVVVHLTFNLPYAVWMMRGFFAEVPLEMEEAALVDGCSPLGAFWRIALPLTTPGLVATGVFCFIFSWSEFFFGVCLTQTKAIPLAVQLPMFFGKQMIMWGNVGALSVIAILPLIVMSFFVQRYLVRGLTLGAVR